MFICFSVWQANSLLQQIWKDTLIFLVETNVYLVWFKSSLLGNCINCSYSSLFSHSIFLSTSPVCFKPKLSNHLLLQVFGCLFLLFALQPYIFIFKRSSIDVSEGKHDGIEGKHDESEREYETGIATASKLVNSSSKKGKGINFFFFYFISFSVLGFFFFVRTMFSFLYLFCFFSSFAMALYVKMGENT